MPPGKTRRPTTERRLPPGRPIQPTGPQACVGPVDRPPELDTPPGRLGAAEARCERRAFIASAGAIVAGNLDLEEREPSRVLRRYLLTMAEHAETVDPTTTEDRRLVREARPCTV